MSSATEDQSANTQGVLLALFSENVFAKILRVAIDALENNVNPTPPLLVSFNVS
jgi:hypothetical protein